eukprot:TRINITY_DN94018_c0_g1_i1.p1 TRINITY_DN94018_c0_g1~~TRINITY_DN94018_c0_g1_i1.p1  ORF type:complete len:621 (+),score=105.61 TRINITY_DN94018_c0_g1_i1:60-1865(+)
MVPPRNAFPEEGTTFGVQNDQFQLGKELGGGSQGRVYICNRLCSGNTYAVKIVNTKAIEMTERTLGNLRREISVMRELHHRRIVNLLEAFWEGALCFIVMDLASGGDLHGKLEQGKGLGSELSARYVSFQLLEGIAYMHAHKVIHRDLKPENVLVVSSRLGPEPHFAELHDVKIGDFGLSKCLKRVGEQAPGMTACGTLDYLAPEVLTGHYDERIDFWSFGVLLYMMLCGGFPFEIEGVTDIKNLGAKRLSPAGAWQSVSSDGKDIVQGLLTVDPRKRLDEKGCRDHPWLAAEVEAFQPGIVSESETSGSNADISPLRGAPGAKTETVPLVGGYPASGSETRHGRFWERHRRGAIRQINGSVGDAVDSVELELRDGTREFHGGKGGFQQRSWRLHHDEVILAVAQEERDSYVGNSLVFYTSDCQIIALQGGDARTRSRLIAPVGSQITGLQFEGSQITGIYLEHLPANGGPMAVEKIYGNVGSAVDRVVLQLRDGSARRYGSAGGKEVGPWILEPDEFILLVEQGRRDAFLGNSICFFTSRGRIIEFQGMQASKSRRFVAPPGTQICGLGFSGSLLAKVKTCPLGTAEARAVDVQEHPIGG